MRGKQSADICSEAGRRQGLTHRSVEEGQHERKETKGELELKTKMKRVSRDSLMSCGVETKTEENCISSLQHYLLLRNLSEWTHD